jgi:myo-inositol-1(or 4)-monophosphatase
LLSSPHAAAARLVHERLAAARPGDGFLGEEGHDEAGSTGVRWVVDPIDGTVNYLYGIPEYAVSVAAQVDGESVAGVVVNAATGTVYAATLGGGATRDGRPVQARPAPDLAEMLVLTGFGYVRDVRIHQAACIARLLPEIRDVRRMGSCALDLCRLAEGRADAYVEEGPQPWDHAAGGLILREAGGSFEVLRGHLAQPGWPERSLVVATGAGGWEAFRAAVGVAGFTA